MRNLVPWNVFVAGRLIDTVWFLRIMNASEVKRSLVEHDGYASYITVKPD